MRAIPNPPMRAKEFVAMRTLLQHLRHAGLAVIAASALTTACSDMPWNSASDPAVSGAGPDRQCQVFRSYLDRSYEAVFPECARQLGEERCRRCLQ